MFPRCLVFGVRSGSGWAQWVGEVSLQICGEKGLGARDTRWERSGGYKGKCSNSPASSLARCGQAEQVDRRASWAGHKQPAGTCTAWTHVLWCRELTSPGAPWHRLMPVSDPGLLAGAGLPPCRSRSRVPLTVHSLTQPLAQFQTSLAKPSQLTVNCRTGRKLSPESLLFWFSKRIYK